MNTSVRPLISYWFHCTENEDAFLSVKPAVRHPSTGSHRSETSRGASPVTVTGANKPGLRSNNESFPDMLSALPASVASNTSMDSSKNVIENNLIECEVCIYPFS